MRYFLLSIIWVFSLSANLVSALTYNDTIPINTGGEQVRISRISEAKLLESYVLRYQEKINSLYSNLSQSESVALENANAQLTLMASALQKIQKKPVSEKDATLIMQSIVQDIKILNIRMKVYLEQEEIISQEKMIEQWKKYQVIGEKISALLERFIEQMTQSLIKKKTLSEKEKEIVRSLVRIREENKKIKNFNPQNFSSQESMRLYFQSIIENIRKEIRTIKSLSTHS